MNFIYASQTPYLSVFTFHFSLFKQHNRIFCQKGAYTLPSARPNFLSEGVRLGLDKEIRLDGTYLKYFPFSRMIERSRITPYHKKLLKTHLINKSLSLRLMTTEVYIKLHWVLVTTLLKKLIAELIGNLLREDTLLLEV